MPQNDDSWTTRLGVRAGSCNCTKRAADPAGLMEVNPAARQTMLGHLLATRRYRRICRTTRVEVKVGIQQRQRTAKLSTPVPPVRRGKNDYGDASFSLNMRYNW